MVGAIPVFGSRWFQFPLLPFLCFSLFASLVMNSLFFLLLLSFSRDFTGLVGIKDPCFFGCLPCHLPENKGRKDSVSVPENGSSGSSSAFGFLIRFGS